jgi:hypothetical protein
MPQGLKPESTVGLFSRPLKGHSCTVRSRLSRRVRVCTHILKPSASWLLTARLVVPFPEPSVKPTLEFGLWAGSSYGDRRGEEFGGEGVSL